MTKSLMYAVTIVVMILLFIYGFVTLIKITAGNYALEAGKKITIRSDSVVISYKNTGCSCDTISVYKKVK